jgi:DNA-binding response OmpR family regulator
VTATQTILVVEDDPAIRRGLEMNLQAEGFRPVAVPTGEAALEIADREEIALVLLDVMLPGISGLEVCRRLRAQGRDLPIILVSARGSERQVIAGLEEGADDYVIKPFRIGELLARMRARLRRSPRIEAYRFGDVEIDMPRLLVRRAGETVDLTPTEFDLLTFFVKREGDALTRDTILAAVWGHDYRGTDRTVDNFVTRLRHKLDTPGKPRFFCTVRGVGYRFEGDA